MTEEEKEVSQGTYTKERELKEDAKRNPHKYRSKWLCHYITGPHWPIEGDGRGNDVYVWFLASWIILQGVCGVA